MKVKLHGRVSNHTVAAQIFTHLSVVSSRQRLYDWLRCEGKYIQMRGGFMSLKINDLLRIPPCDIDKVKIKFNQPSPDEDPLELYRKNPDIVNTQWLFWREQRRYFYEGQIAVCFLKIGWDKWLLTTIKKITKDLNVEGGISYDGYELQEYKSYYGRLIIQFHKTFQTQGIYYKNVCDELIVNQLLPAMFDGYDFPGYDEVRLTWEQLEIIIKQHKKDWIAALQNQKAVYLITDRSNGKLYVGSATSNNGMLLQRWENYINSGHGGNKELIDLVNKEGIDYIKRNFQYSILENYNAKVDDQVILERESWWKETLQSRKFGYNAN